MMTSNGLGQAGETAAATYLTCQGYKILERNFRTKFGEIDLIARCGQTVVFVEVKTRRNTNYAQPGEHVTKHKQRKLLKTARYYLHCTNQDNVAARFDVIEVLATPLTLKICNHIVNAFGE